VLDHIFNLTKKSNLIDGRLYFDLTQCFDNLGVAYFLGPPCIFYVWPSLWHPHLLCLKLQYGWNQRIWWNHVCHPEKRDNMEIKVSLHKASCKRSFRHSYFTAC